MRVPLPKVRELVEAVRAEGLRAGLYYSLLDWRHPEYPVDKFHPQAEDAAFREAARGRDVRKYAAYMRDQVRELLTGYGRIDYLFLDYSFPGPDGKGRAEWESEKLLALIRELQPGILVNDRLDLLDVSGGWDFRTPEQFMPRDWVTVDGKRVPWETCQTFSGSWGYHRDEASWKSARQLIVMLIEVVSKGGNLLLNVGPTGRGEIDERAQSRLDAIGRWMRRHDRAITGCTEAPPEIVRPGKALFTYNPSSRRLYLHLLEWPMGLLALDGLGGRIRYAQLLNDASEIPFKDASHPRDLGYMGFLPGSRRDEDGGAAVLRLPAVKPDVEVPVIEIFLA